MLLFGLHATSLPLMTILRVQGTMAAHADVNAPHNTLLLVAAGAQ
jgi:hypothetical protein